MLMDLAILAEDESGGRILFVVAVIILVVGGAIFEKLKQAAAEAERRGRMSQSPSRGPSIPPVARPPLGRVNPPTIPAPRVPPPVSTRGEPRWPPVVATDPMTRRRNAERPRPRPAPEPEQRQRPPRRQIAPEVARPAEAAVPLRPGKLGDGVQQAIGDLERQVQGEFRGQVGALQPVQSLVQMRAAQKQADASAVEPALARKPTLADLRRAIMLNEILGPPLALRESD